MIGHGNTAAILLASGFSRRFGGGNKLLVPFKGKPLARYTLELVSKLDFYGGIYFIAASPDVAALAADFGNIRVVKNPAPEKGLGESVRLGVLAAEASAETYAEADAEVGAKAGAGAAYYLFFHCDEPFLDAPTVQLILDAREQACIVEPTYRDKPGNPCLFSSVFRDELLSLKEGETPSLIKTRHPKAIKRVEVLNPLVLEDIDNEEEFLRLSSL